MWSKILAYAAGAALFLDIAFAELAIQAQRHPQRHEYLRGGMPSNTYEVSCAGGCGATGKIPNRNKSGIGYCWDCAAKESITNTQKKFRKQETKAQKSERNVIANQFSQEVRSPQSEAQLREIVAENPLASTEARAARNAELVKLCKSKPPAGKFFTHELLGESKRCVCNCAFIKLLGEYPIQVRVLMLFLMGSVPMQIGDIVSIPEITLLYAYYVAKTAKEHYPDQVDHRAPMPWNFWERQKEKGRGALAEMRTTGLASQYDNAKAPVYGSRVSIKLNCGNSPLPPALPRTAKGVDSLGVCVWGEVDTSGSPVWQFPVWAQ